MATKHFANNSVLRRASQFENLNHEQSGSQPLPDGPAKRTSLPRKDDISNSTSTNNASGCSNNCTNTNVVSDPVDHFITSAYARFQHEYASLYPNSTLPFEELNSLNEAKECLKLQQQRVVDLNKEINKAKFSVKFLQEIISHNEKKDFDTGSLSSAHYSDKAQEESTNGESTSSKEQYVTVITLNDSTYGEIQRQKVSPNSSLQKFNSNTLEKLDDETTCSTNDQHLPAEKNETATKEKSEPIYSNTLESQKNSDRVARKRPPTPPRKPKFNKLQGSSGDIFGSLSSSSPTSSISKSESLKSISRIQRKFNGPLQQISDGSATSSNNKSPDVDSSKDTIANTANKVPYMRTFSHESKLTTNRDTGSTTVASKQIETDEDEEEEVVVVDENVDNELYKDYDNIYDTVAPDSDCDSDLTGDKTQSMKDEDIETSSHEMLSRSSSTDEGLSNYVNIDYFLRKNSLGRNSLGRSNSNIPTRLKKNGEENYDDTEVEDNDTNLSSMKSSDYDNFSSNENLINAIPPQSISLKSFNSVSSTTNSSTSGSSLRTRSLKLLNSNSSDLSASYPPNLSTFTPPIRDRNQPAFFKESPLSEEEEPALPPFRNGADLNISPIAKVNKSLPAKNDHSVEYYAYTDILDSLPTNDNEPKVAELADESIQLENKSLASSQEDSISDDSKLQAKSEQEHCRHMQWSIIRSIIESETIYLDCLNTLQQYMKALSTTTSGRDNALLSTDDLNAIFYRIPDLYQVHNQFLNGLKNVEHGYKMKNSKMTGESMLATKLMTKHSVGDLFFRLASSLGIYSDFLRNYSKALETANRCSASNTKFSDIIKSIKVASLNGQFTNLVDLLHKPVARLQKNALVLHDLIKYADSRNEEEQNLLKEALGMTQNFLNELNLDATRKLFPVQDKFQRRLVKESFIVESGENRRKLRHLFLFNDVIVCAKYKASTKQKFTFELKWFQMLNDIVLDPALEPYSSSNYSSSTLNRSTLNSSSGHSSALNSSSASASAKESKETINSFHQVSQVEMLKSRQFACRYDNFIEEKKSKGSSKSLEKHRKKIYELESELVLWLPPLKFAFCLKNSSHKNQVFYLSSEYERTCWVDAIRHMQQVSLNSLHTEHVSALELQRWIESCRKIINPNLGTFLLRTNKDESLRFGDLMLRFVHLNGYNHRQKLYFVIETDSYGHYFKQAVTKYVSDNETENIKQEFLLELEGTQSLRILCYETPKRSLNERGEDVHSRDQEVNERNAIFKGKASFDLTSSCLSSEYRTKELSILEYSLTIEMNFVSWRSMMEKIPPSKICGTFGIRIAQVCKKEKSKIPFIIMSCINEVQRRGLREMGIYRVSGLNSDIQRLRKAFETNPRDASWMVSHVDIHAVTGLLKNYLRDLPESLFTNNDIYQKYTEARDVKNVEEKERRMTTLLGQLPEPNKSTIIYLIEHLVTVNRYEEDNKMSLNNLATVFGPTMLKTNSSSGGNNANSKNANLSSSCTPSSGANTNSNFSSSFAINTDLFTASTIDVMAQADIIYFYLRRSFEGLDLTCVDREETSL